MREEITVNTQSSIKIVGSKVLYFDPWQIEGEPHDANIIFITHEHYDHFSPEDIAKVSNDKTMVVFPQSMEREAANKTGIPSDNLVFMQPKEQREVSRLMIEAIPAYNNKKPFHMKRSQWLGYVVTMDAEKYYVAGDTDVTPESWDVRCDVALLPIGGTYTMDAKAAAELAGHLSPRLVIPTHYGSIVGSPADGELFQTLIQRGIQVELKLPL